MILVNPVAPFYNEAEVWMCVVSNSSVCLGEAIEKPLARIGKGPNPTATALQCSYSNV